MFRAKSQIEIKAPDRSYQFLCDYDSPLSEVIDALETAKKHVEEMLADIEKKKNEDEVKSVD